MEEGDGKEENAEQTREQNEGGPGKAAGKGFRNLGENAVLGKSYELVQETSVGTPIEKPFIQLGTRHIIGSARGKALQKIKRERKMSNRRIWQGKLERSGGVSTC